MYFLKSPIKKARCKKLSSIFEETFLFNIKGRLFPIFPLESFLSAMKFLILVSLLAFVAAQDDMDMGGG